MERESEKLFSEATWFWLENANDGLAQVFDVVCEESDEYYRCLENNIFTKEEAGKILTVSNYIDEEMQDFLCNLLKDLDYSPKVKFKNFRKGSDFDNQKRIFYLRKGKRSIEAELYLKFSPIGDDDGYEYPFLWCGLYVYKNQPVSCGAIKDLYCEKLGADDYEDPVAKWVGEDGLEGCIADAVIPLTRSRTLGEIKNEVDNFFNKYIIEMKNKILSL